MKTKDGIPVFLHELASVEVGGAIRRGVQTRNGLEEVVAGMVVKLFGTNSSTVIGQVEAKMAEINRILPTGVKLIPYYEQKTLVTACVATVRNALIQGVVLVVLVLMLFMGSLRPSLVVALALPFSVLFATLGLGYLGVSANLMVSGRTRYRYRHAGRWHDSPWWKMWTVCSVRPRRIRHAVRSSLRRVQRSPAPFSSRLQLL